jgi:hypothetical protein
MANFVRDGVALDVPESQLALLKISFDKADNKITELQGKLDGLETITLDGKKYLADSFVSAKICELTNKICELTSYIDGKVVLDELQNKQAVAELVSKDSETQKELTELRGQVDRLQAKEEALLKELEAKSSAITDSIEERVTRRRKLERQVFPLLDAQEEVLEKMSDRRLKEEVITSRYSDSIESLSTRSDEAIDAMFEIAVKHSQSDSVKEKVILPNTVATNDSANSLAAAQREYIESIENAHKLIIGA